MIRVIESLLVAPTTRSTSFPSLKRINVGIPLIPYRCALAVLSSTFNLTTVALEANSDAIWSMIGPIIRHGAHHSAQKSTSTGLVDCRTSCSKELSVMCFTCSLISFPFPFPCSIYFLETKGQTGMSVPQLLAMSFDKALQYTRP